MYVFRSNLIKKGKFKKKMFANKKYPNHSTASSNKIAKFDKIEEKIQMLANRTIPIALRPHKIKYNLPCVFALFRTKKVSKNSRNLPSTHTDRARRTKFQVRQNVLPVILPVYFSHWLGPNRITRDTGSAERDPPSRAVSSRHWAKVQATLYNRK